MSKFNEASLPALGIVVEMLFVSLRIKSIATESPTRRGTPQ